VLIGDELVHLGDEVAAGHQGEWDDHRCQMPCHDPMVASTGRFESGPSLGRMFEDDGHG